MTGPCVAPSWPVRRTARVAGVMQAVPAASESTYWSSRNESDQDSDKAHQNVATGSENVRYASAPTSKVSIFYASRRKLSEQGRKRYQKLNGTRVAVNELLTAWTLKALSLNKLNEIFKRNKRRVNEINVVAMLNQLSMLYEDGGDTSCKPQFHQFATELVDKLHELSVSSASSPGMLGVPERIQAVSALARLR